MQHHFRILALSLAALFVLPALSGAAVVDRGIDLWQTHANGSTFADFAKFPIPAGFFCSRSEAFTGRIVLRGTPVATGLPGELGQADTIVERLDRATFDDRGTASTRIKVRALQLESVAPLSTACGDYNLRVTLHGNQPVTRMQIVQERADGGHFSAPLQMNIKLTFTPVSGKSAERRELVRRNFRLSADPRAPWAVDHDKRSVSRSGPVWVDTDADSAPDSLLPGISASFVPGLRSGHGKAVIYVCCPQEYSPVCHSGSDGQHCNTYVMDPNSYSCC